MYIIENTVSVLFNIIELLIIARVILSWIRPNTHNQQWRQLIRFIYQVTEPILAPIRRILPTSNMGIDFSPFIAILALSIIQGILF